MEAVAAMPHWQETLDDLDRRRQHTRAMGGRERLAKHRGKGKLDARARIDHLLDPGTFRELGTLVGGEIAADGIVVGSGLINGSPVMLGAEDFTTMAGSIGPGGNSKRYRIAELALREKIPLVMLLEGAGYETQVFEFVSLEHTSKNKMILAVKGGAANPQALAQVRDIKAFYGIREQRLEALLQGDAG